MIRGGGNTDAGIQVNDSTALKFSAVYASVRVIAETKGSLPVEVYEIKGDSQIRTHFHPVAEVLGIEPNLDHTPMVFGETRQSHLLTRGNTYAEITWTHGGDVFAITPHHPANVEPFKDAAGRLKYKVKEGNSSRTIDRDDMVHVPGLGGDGIVGWSPIRMAAESIGVGLANERFASLYFSNGARPSLVLETGDNLDDQTFQSLKDEVNHSYSGPNTHKAMLLQGGITAKQMSIPLNEAQFLEAREFQGEEIACRWYRLPPHVVGYLRRATFSNIEAQDQYFEKHTMRPWLVRDEQELHRKLFPRGERHRWKIKYNANAILRSDIKTRYEAHKTAILAGFKSRNEIRQLEDLNPVDGLDEFPLPEAIFGKTGDSSAKPDDKEKPQAGDRSDPRLHTLTLRTLTGLIHRELTMVDRAAGKPAEEFKQKVNEFYTRHKSHVRERLDGIATPSQLADLDRVLDKHCEQLRTAGPGKARDACGDWIDDADRLTSSLLDPEATT